MFSSVSHWTRKSNEKQTNKQTNKQNSQTIPKTDKKWFQVLIKKSLSFLILKKVIKN